MSHNVVYNDAILPIAQNASSFVTTILICQSNLIRSGIGLTLARTPFVLTEEEPEPLSELPILCLIHMDHAAIGLAETIEQLKAQWPSCRVVLLADSMEPAATGPALQAGLDGLCSTGTGRAPLIKALEFVMLGETFISAAAGLALLEQWQAVPQARGSSLALTPANDFASVSRLSDREAQILHFLTKGASNKQISREIGLAESTVKVHLKAILRKVRVANRTQAAIWAQQHLNRTAKDALNAAE